MTASQRASKAARFLNAPHYLSTVNGSREEVGRRGEGKRQMGEKEAMDGWTRRGCGGWGGFASSGDTSVSRKCKETVVVMVGLIRDRNEILNREEKIA